MLINSGFSAMYKTAFMPILTISDIDYIIKPMQSKERKDVS